MSAILHGGEEKAVRVLQRKDSLITGLKLRIADLQGEATDARKKIDALKVELFRLEASGIAVMWPSDGDD